ncbi:MAG: hypothetical protein GX539_09615 [Candidatus Cloacimonetes bacterium]|nr:hypothetical protein [Candidatus Cloacimonadota bacterium]
MSEATAVQGIVIAHGTLADGLIDAVRQITGTDGGLRPISNSGLGPDGLAEAVRDNLEQGPAILFTDLKSGSCGMVAHRLLRDRKGLHVLAGVNLAMLLTFVLQRTQPVERLLPLLVEKGRSSIGCSPDLVSHDADRSAAN